MAEGASALASFAQHFELPSLPRLPLDLGSLSNRTAQLCAALVPTARLHVLSQALHGVPAPRGAALWLLSASALLLLLRCARVRSASRRIYAASGRSRHELKED